MMQEENDKAEEVRRRKSSGERWKTQDLSRLFSTKHFSIKCLQGSLLSKEYH